MKDTSRDPQLKKLVRREFNKHMIELGQADLMVMHGVVYLRGAVSAVAGAKFEIREEVARIGRNLRQITGIRDVIIECSYKV